MKKVIFSVIATVLAALGMLLSEMSCNGLSLAADITAMAIIVLLSISMTRKRGH